LWIADSIYSDSIKVTVGDSSGYMMVEDYNTCGIDSAKDSIMITVNPAPAAPNVGYIGGQFLTTDPAHHYQWFRNDTLLLNDTFPYITPTIIGAYYLEIFDSLGCFANSISHIYTSTGPEISQNNNFIIFPNPNAGTFTIKYHIQNSQFSMLNSQFIIEDVTGRTVFKDMITGTNGTKFIDVSNLDNGIYYWEMMDAEGTSEKGKIAIIKPSSK
jgi:hypothetical protein